MSRSLPFLTCSLAILLCAGDAAAQTRKGIEAAVEKHLMSARQAEQSGDLARATSHYQEAVKFQPSNATLRQSLGLTLHLRGLYAEAASEFEKAIGLDTTLWGAYLFLGIDYYRTNQFANAIPVLQRSIELKRDMAEGEARFWLGASHLALAHYEPAIDELRRLLELKPEDVEALYHMAKAYDQYASALFEQIGKAQPNSALVYLLQAERLVSESRLPLARRWYGRAVAVRPDLADALPELQSTAIEPEAKVRDAAPSDIRANEELARYFASVQQEERVRRHLKVLEQLRPAARDLDNRIDAAQQVKWKRIFAARSHAVKDDLSSAVRELKAAAKEMSDDVEAAYELGRLYKQLAARTLQRLISIAPESHRSLQLVAERHENATEYQQALQSYQAALAQQSGLAGLRYAIGNVYWKMHQYDEAARWLGEELKINPNHGLAHFRLGSIHVEQGKHDEALRHLAEALRIRPGLTDALLPLGRAYLAKQDFNRALEVLRQYAQADRDNDRVHYLMANALQRLGRAKEAEAEMQSFQELNRRRHEQVQADVSGIKESNSETKP